MRTSSVNPEIRKIISDSIERALDGDISFIIQRVNTKDNPADVPSRKKLDENSLTNWLFFWQDTSNKLSWQQYLNWIQQNREERPFHDNARALLAILKTQRLRIPAIDSLSREILAED
jgi:hypothetical protein